MLIKGALFLSSLALAQRQGYDTWPRCQPVDITFILDGSKSIKYDYFTKSVDMAKHIVKVASRGNNWNRFAVMQFSHGKNTLELQMNHANQFGYANDPFHNIGTRVGTGSGRYTGAPIYRFIPVIKIPDFIPVGYRWNSRNLYFIPVKYRPGSPGFTGFFNPAGFHRVFESC